jgi:abortive infection bacteriophage resistance protein
LKSRGLIVEDEDFAIRALQRINYYRLSAYALSLKHNDQAPAVYLESWLKCLSYVRNICAHYGRMYNRPLTSKPRLHPKAKRLGIRQDRIFAHLYVLKQLISDRNKWNNSFIIRLQSLLDEFEHVVELDCIGFPEDWEKLLRK